MPSATTQKSSSRHASPPRHASIGWKRRELYPDADPEQSEGEAEGSSVEHARGESHWRSFGIFSLRGAIVTLLDIRSQLKQPPPKGDQRIIVVHDGAGLAGFEVDRVLRPAKIDRSAIEPQPVVTPGEESDFIRGVVRNENALTIVLDLAKLLM